MPKLLALVFCIPLVVGSPVSAVEVGAFRFTVRAGGYTFKVPYDANRSLSVSSTQVQHAVLLLHGSSRSAANAYETLLEALDLAGLGSTPNLLVAPQFLIEADIVSNLLPTDHLFWGDSGWKEGNASQSTAANPRPAALSSFAVMDSILYAIGTRYPNLQTLVLAGRSAGGQFIHRFAAGSTVADVLANAFGVEVRFVVANPSSYIYMNTQRVVAGTLDQFAVPSSSTIASCPGYDDYKYGLQDRNNYMSQLSASQIRSRFPQQRVTYLLGELDDDPAALDLDTSCAAMLQGSNRLERGLIFGSYVRHVYGASGFANHRTIVVPDVGHSAENMFRSPCGVGELFGVGNCDPVAIAPETTDGTAPLELGPGEPNPFGSQTTIVYAVPDGRRRTTLRVFDVRGRVVRTLLDGAQVERTASVVWDGRSDAGQRVAAGVYFYRLQHGLETITRRVALLR